jgi:hypothetical protein
VRGIFSGKILTTLVLVAILTLALNIQSLRAEATTISNSNTPLVYVIVNASIYEDIKFHIDRYIEDIQRIGFKATILLFSGGKPEDMKAILRNALSEGLVGCLFVGDIPYAVYEDREFDHEEFPIDLFYMDLNGIWRDIDNNGKYDQHLGDRTPEIWVGRIKAPDMYRENEVSLIKKYLDKNHNYRTGTLSLPERALIYIDDEWTQFSAEVDSAVALSYSNRTLVNEAVITSAVDYLNRLTQNWSLVHLMVHGSFGYHDFKVNGEWGGLVIPEDLRSTNSRAFFYNLFSCKAAKYDEIDYIGGWYIFSDTSYGLAVIAPTDAGGMWFFSDFYSNLENETLGFAFKQWLAKRVAGEDSGSWYDKSWYYGMTILGDPTLSLKPEKPRIEDIAITDVNPYRTVLSNSTITSVNVTTENQGGTTETFNVTLYYNTSQIGTQTVTLFGSQSKVLTFRWNTIGLSLGRYTISGYISPVPNETEIMDNEFVDGWIAITIPGDINADGTVNILDVAKAARAFGSYPGYLKWDSNADVNEDKMINIIDLALIAKEYGRTA